MPYQHWLVYCPPHWIALSCFNVTPLRVLCGHVFVRGRAVIAINKFYNLGWDNSDATVEAYMR